MVYGLLSIQFWLFAILTPIIFGISFYIPGSFFIERLKPKSVIVSFLLSFVLGIALWGIQGYIFGYLHIRWFSYFYLLFFAGVFLSNLQYQKQELKKLKLALKLSFRPALYFILVGTVLQVLSVIGSGLSSRNGVEFFFTNAVDGVMHLAYIGSLVKNFPPQEPSAAGMMLTNYHYWSDLVIAELARVWHLPVAHLFFQFMPILVSFLTGMSAYLIIRIWKGSRRTGLWSLFLLYFSGDAAYLFMLLLHQKFGFQTPAIDNGITQFLNIPHSFAKLVFMTALIPFSYWLKTKQLKWLGLTIILFATLAGFKIYFGIFAVLGFCLVVFGQLIQSFISSPNKKWLVKTQKTFHKHQNELFFLILFGIISAAIYFPANKSSGGLFYSPLEWPKIFMGPDGLNFREWWLRHQVYDAAHNYRNIIILDVGAIGICLISIYGTRLLGFLNWKKMIKLLGWEVYLFFFPTMLVFTWLGLYTLQHSGLFNVFNFFAVASVGLSLFSAFILDELQSSSKRIAHLCLIVFVILTVPRPLYEVVSISQAYLNNQSSQLISRSEIAALESVQQHTDPKAVIQAYNNETDQKTPYVAFFANRSTYLSGDGLLTSHNQPIEDRIQGLKYLFGAHSSSELAARAKEKNIKLIYLHKVPTIASDLPYPIQNEDFRVLFENDQAKVLERVN